MNPSVILTKIVASVAVGGLAASVVVTSAFAVSHPSEQTFRHTAAVEVPAGNPPTTSTTAMPPGAVETAPPAPAAVLGVPVETAPLVVLEAPTTTTTTTVAVTPPTLAKPGHYACTGDDNATVDCANDETGVDVTPNHGDDPAALQANADPADTGRLNAEYCAAKPWTCP